MGSLLATLLPATAGMAWLLSASLKVALLLVATWLGAALLRRGTAAARHQIWALGVTGALLLPLLCWALPSLPLPLPLLLETPTIGVGRSLLATAVFVTGGGSTGAGPSWPAWLALAWAVGALLVALRFLRGHFAARRLARAAQPAHAQAWLSARHEAAAALAIAGDVGLGRSEAIASPMTIGVLHPQVLLPVAADAWSPGRLRAVLMHELGHVRRHDTLIQLVAQLACALYWWNPLAWLAAARLRVEREQACDDLVLEAGIQPSSYAADLLAVARCISPDQAAHVVAIRMVEPSWMEARLRRILDPATPHRPLGARFRRVARVSTLVFVVTLACTSAPRTLPAPSGPSPAAARRVAHGTLSLGTLSARDAANPWEFQPLAFSEEDPLYLSMVEKEVQRHMGDLQQCFERRLSVHPELSGEVLMHWVIAADGKVVEQCVRQDSLGDEEIRACLNKLIQDSQFPTPCGGSTRDVSFPFVFTASR